MQAMTQGGLATLLQNAHPHSNGSGTGSPQGNGSVASTSRPPTAPSG